MKITNGECWYSESEYDRLAAELAESQRQVAELIAEKTTWDKVVENYEHELAECKATDIAKLKHDVEFWKSTAERRGDELKRLYTEMSHKE